MGIYEFNSMTMFLSLVQIIVLGVIAVNIVTATKKIEGIADKLGVKPATGVVPANATNTTLNGDVDNPGLK